MKITKQIQAFLIRISILPFKKREIISFKEHFTNANRVVVLLPETRNDPAIQEGMDELIDTLKGKELILVSSGEQTMNESQKGIKQVNLKLNKLNLWTFSLSENLKKIVGDSSDIFIDLNDPPHLLGIYISRKINTPVCVCMTSAPYAASFNLIYNHSNTSSYSDKLNGFVIFIKQLIN